MRALFLGGLLMAACSSVFAAASTRLGLPDLPATPSHRPNAAAIALGRKLFFDQRLSADGTISCASCHDPAKGFVDGKRLAEGIGGRAGTRNAPSLLNAAFNTSQFWDGRRATLEEQALDPLVNPREQGLPGYPALLALLRNDAAYAKAFEAAFSIKPPDIDVVHVGMAIASFERTLLAGDSRFDRFFYGHVQDALSPSEQRGLALFRGPAHCGDCHLIGSRSALLSDNAFHSLNIGIQRIGPRMADLTTRLVRARESAATLDDTILSQEDLAELGRFAVTLAPADIGKFRTPSLRNVALTAPYMHDGSVPTLAAAVDAELYRRGSQAGRPLILTPQERLDLVAFLDALTGSDALTYSPPPAAQ